MNTELAPRHADDTVLKQAGSPQSLLADAKVSENLYANHLSFWNKKSIALEEIVWKLPDECVNELENVCENGQVEKTNNLQTDLPKTVEFTDKLRTALSFGSGIAIVDGFRVKHNSEEANRLQCKLFSSLLATLMPQNISGDILYDVKDKKVANPEGVRKSITNAEQPFHTDGGWMNPPARFIGSPTRKRCCIRCRGTNRESISMAKVRLLSIPGSNSHWLENLSVVSTKATSATDIP